MAGALPNGRKATIVTPAATVLVHRVLPSGRNRNAAGCGRSVHGSAPDNPRADTRTVRSAPGSAAPVRGTALRETEKTLAARRASERRRCLRILGLPPTEPPRPLRPGWRRYR